MECVSRPSMALSKAVREIRDQSITRSDEKSLDNSAPHET